MGDYSKIFSRIWNDPEFAGQDGLSDREQLTYLMLLSYPTRNDAGVLPLTLRRWVRAAKGRTLDELLAALNSLQNRRFILMDQDTEEVLIRSFIRNDELYRQPNPMLAALKDCKKVESEILRKVLQEELIRVSTLMPVEKDLQQRVHQETLTVAKSLYITPPEGLMEGLGEPFVANQNNPLYKPLPQPSVNSPTTTTAPTTATNPPSGDSQGVLVPVERKPVVESSQRGTRLPENWEPDDEVKKELAARYPNLNLRLVLEEFKNYWLSVPGQKGRKVDWIRTFRNRVSEVSQQSRLQLRPLEGADSKGMGWQELKERRREQRG